VSSEGLHPRSRNTIALQAAGAFLLFGGTWVVVSVVLLHGSMASWAIAFRGSMVLTAAVLMFFWMRHTVGRLRAAEAKTRAILECISDGVLLVGSDTKISGANRAAVRMLGMHDERELVGIGPEEFSRRFRVTSPDGRRIRPEQFISQRALRGEVCETYRAILHLDSGAELVIASSGAPVRRSPDEPVLLSVSVMHDVTRLHDLERARDRLYAAAAHSFKTPVAIIKGHAQLMAANPGERTRASTAVIDRQCRRLDCLIQNLLVLVRLRSGALHLHPSNVELGGLVESALALEDGRRRSVVYRPEANPRAFVDPARVELVIRDLIEAAIHRSQPGTEILLSLTEGDHWAEVRTHYRRLEGRGPADLLPRTDSVSGVLDELDEHTGLKVGRHVVEKIIQAHGGSFGIDALSSETESDWVRLPTLHPRSAHDALH
jgi:two-component system phosphate regulon sensor histidine kinase PhoR